jgi:hypothetical protein
LKLITKQLPDNHNIFHFGDRHKGAILSSDKGWGQLVNMMLSPYDGCKNNYGINGGDLIEAIMVDDPRFSLEELKKWVEKGELSAPIRPLAQMRAVKAELEPIKHLLLVMLEGNHDRKLWRFGNIVEDICRDLGVDYGTYTAKISIVDKHGDLMYKIFETHGSKSINSAADDPIRKQANEILMLKRKLRKKAGDCAIMIKHHAHKLLIGPPIEELYLSDDGKKITQHYTSLEQNAPFIHPDARWYGCAGAFLRLYGEGVSGYGEVAEYDPTELGWLVTKVRRKKIVAVEPVFMKL